MTLNILMLALSSTFAFANPPGASATWVRRDHQHRTGVLEYLDQGADSVIDRRRSDALDKMSDFCDHKAFKILSENNEVEDFHGYGHQHGPSLAAAFGDGARAIALIIDRHPGPDVPQGNYNYITFKCSK